MLVTRHLVSVWSCQTFLDGLDQSPNVSWITSLAHIKDIQIASNGKAVSIICKAREVKTGANKGKKMSLQLLIPSRREEITAAVLTSLALQIMATALPLLAICISLICANDVIQ